MQDFVVVNDLPEYTTPTNSDLVLAIKNDDGSLNIVPVENLLSLVSGLSAGIKAALLQIASKVAYIDANGQDYYNALHDALYPPAGLVSISAIYTQSGTVYDTDSLDSLKTDLVVTALYDNSTTETISSSNYTLSGTLTEGTSTITVLYGGKTDTFDVTVSDKYLYNWDFTESLVDKVSNREAELRGTNGAKPTRTNNGLVFDAATQNVNLGTIALKGKTVEVDVASFQFAGSTSNHIRFIMCPISGGTVSGAGPLIYRANNGWQGYGPATSGTTVGSWGGAYSGLSGNTDAVRNVFSGKTVKLVFSSDSNKIEVFADDESKGSITGIATSDFNSLVIGAGYSGWAEGNGDQCYNMTITGVRVYAN